MLLLPKRFGLGDEFLCSSLKRNQNRSLSRYSRKRSPRWGSQTYIKGIAVSLKKALELPTDVFLSSWLTQAFSCSADDGPVLVHGLFLVVSHRFMKRGLVVLAYLVKSIVDALSCCLVGTSRQLGRNGVPGIEHLVVAFDDPLCLNPRSAREVLTPVAFDCLRSKTRLLRCCSLGLRGLVRLAFWRSCRRRSPWPIARPCLAAPSRRHVLRYRGCCSEH